MSAALVVGCNIDTLWAEFYVVESTGESSSGSGSTGGSSGSESSGSTTSGTVSSGGEARSTGEAEGSSGEGETTEAGTSGADAEVCGDGVVAGEEECDDGNEEEGDACGNDCALAWKIFVTSESMFTGDINGLTGADTRCRHLAELAGVPRAMHFKALLSDSTTDAAERLHHARGWYRLVNGLPVARGWEALMSEPLENPVNVTEQSTTANHLSVWTGTLPGGIAVPGASHCMDWTSVSALQKGHYGESHVVDGGWLHDPLEQYNPSDCGFSAYALYCVEQP